MHDTHESVQSMIDRYRNLPRYDPSWSFTLIPDNSHNKHYRVERPDGEPLFCKICQHDQRVFDICEREQLTSMFGTALSLPLVTAWVSRLPPHVLAEQADERYVGDRVSLMNYVRARTARDYPEIALRIFANRKSVLGDLFAFLHWLGDEDRGLEDVMISGTDFTIVDGGLCGPRQGQQRLRGAHPHGSQYGQLDILRKCHPDKPVSLLGFVVKRCNLSKSDLSHPNVIPDIQALSDDAIKAISQACGMENFVPDTLIHRRNTLPADYESWLVDIFKFIEVIE